MQIIQPGQAYVNRRIIQTNTSQDIAWKNGLFDFSGQSITTIMKQLERWYDIDVQFEGQVSDIKIGGKMDRGFPLQNIIEFFERVGVHSRLEGRVLILSD